METIDGRIGRHPTRDAASYRYHLQPGYLFGAQIQLAANGFGCSQWKRVLAKQGRSDVGQTETSTFGQFLPRQVFPCLDVENFSG
ncbi:hypothetical protein D3C75_1235500 [compost metagenome]